MNTQVQEVHLSDLRDILRRHLSRNVDLKGASVGGAEVSEKHSGFIINKNNATCEDVKNLIAYVKKEVYKQKGVELHCEVKFIGI